eukprot:EW710510.1.p5 GENE.EW710510.1~~EW710510.1.p5  ORF type:complete len:51 (-),score=13.31 EW710510.1:66-218(-)
MVIDYITQVNIGRFRKDEDARWLVACRGLSSSSSTRRSCLLLVRRIVDDS